MKKAILTFAAILFLSLGLSATTRNAASCSLSDVQAAVNLAVDGDIVQVPAGACTWTGTLTWTDVNLTLQGANPCTVGTGVQGCVPVSSSGPTANSSTSTVLTLSTGTAISATLNTKPFRITGFYFVRNQAASITIAINQNSSYLNTKVNGIRIDHNVFDDRNFAGNNDVAVNGWVFGLQDHNSHYVPLGDQSTLITEPGVGESDSNLSALTGSAAWSRASTLGTADSWYVEDSNFFVGNSTSSSSWPNPIMGDGTAGNRFVVRHSTFCGGAVETHGAYSRGTRGTSQWEVYNNDFFPYFSDCVTDSSINAGYQYDAIKLRGGTGVIFNNNFHGGTWDSGGGPIYFDVERGNDANAHTPINTRCDGTQAYDGNAAPSTTYGWPCLDQIGRGPGNATPSGFTESQWPVMLWNNNECTGNSCTSPVAATPVIDPAIAIHPYQSDLLQSGRDWVVLSGTGTSNSSTSPVAQSYTAYTYPHPLQSGTPTYTLIVTVTGTGTVTSSDSNISCTSAGTGCSASYVSGSTVTLAASSSGTTVVWGGACSGTSTTCGPLTITANTTATAAFTAAVSTVATPVISPSSGAVPQTVTITSSTSGALIIYTVDGSSPRHGGSCSAICIGGPSSVSCSKNLANGGSISITSPATVQAEGCIGGYIDSALATATFTAASPTTPVSNIDMQAGSYTASRTISAGTSVQIASGTPMTSQSSANSQIVTCPPGGTTTQYCGADGAWHLITGGSATWPPSFTGMSFSPTAGAVTGGTTVTVACTGGTAYISCDGAMSAAGATGCSVTTAKTLYGECAGSGYQLTGSAAYTVSALSNLGNSAIETTPDYVTSYLVGSTFVASGTGTYAGTAHVYCGNGIGTVLLGVYATSGGSPSGQALIASSGSISCTATAGWRTASITAPVVSGKTYFLGMNASSAGVAVYYTTGGTGYYGSFAWTGTLPSTAPTMSSDTNLYSEYISQP